MFSGVRKMKISETLTQEKFQEILLHAFLKGEKSENIKASELVEEIKQQVLVSTK
jgi:hypothetical protein